MKYLLLLMAVFSMSYNIKASLANSGSGKTLHIAHQKNTGFADAADFGFVPGETGIANSKALQKALDHGGTIYVNKAGTYKLAATVYIGDNTSLVFGNNVFIEKVSENGDFTHIILNKGALTKKYNQHISVTGLNLQVNGVEKWWDQIYGLRGQLAFVYVKDLKINNFRCTDLGRAQFCIQVCTFEDLLIDDVIIKGRKDGIHLGRGKRFRISNAVFQTADDAIALAAGDWISGNPELGSIEQGLIENCYDLKAEILEGAFAKIVASAWIDWKKGIVVRHGDAVVANGRIYRVLAGLDGRSYVSVTKPNFKEGSMELDGIKWMMHQADTIYTAVVRNITFRDIYLESLRVPFQFMCYDNNYSHSYYRGAPLPVHGEITLDNVTVLNADKRALISISSPCDMITIKNSIIRSNSIDFIQGKDLTEYLKTYVSFLNCTFKSPGEMLLIKNNCAGKHIILKTLGSIITGENFSAKILEGTGKIKSESDLPGCN